MYGVRCAYRIITHFWSLVTIGTNPQLFPMRDYPTTSHLSFAKSHFAEVTCLSRGPTVRDRCVDRGVPRAGLRAPTRPFSDYPDRVAALRPTAADHGLRADREAERAGQSSGGEEEDIG